MPNLPVFLGSKSNVPAAGTGATHAQDFSTTKLNQEKQRDAARVSMHQATRAKAGSRDTMPTTSIAHTLDVTTTEDTADPYQGYSEEQRDEIRTRLRYQHIRTLLKEKKSQKKSS